MNALQNIFKLLSKGFDLSGGAVKDDDLKVILIGISGIFALAVGAVKVDRNYMSVKRIFKLRSK